MMDEHDQSRERERDRLSPADLVTGTGGSTGNLVVDLAFAGGLVVLGAGIWFASKKWKSRRTG